MTDTVMEEIIASFEDQVSLIKTFSLLVKGTDISERSVKALANFCFPFMPNLESLTLNLDKLEVSDEAFCFMCRSFELFARNLKFFKINLDVAGLTDMGISTLAEFGLALMVNLESLELNFNYNNNIKQGLVKLFTQIQNCAQKLQALVLSLPGVTLLPEAIELLATGVFPNLKSLARLQLGIYETNITDSEFELLFSGLKGGVLENLSSFVFALYEDGITGQAFDVLSKDIIPQLKSVKTFKCYICNNQNITDENLRRFSGGLQEVGSKIVELMFRFEGTEISNEGVKEFASKTLGEMKSLKDADASFGFNARVNDEGIVNLFDGLEGIVERLSSLQLSLQSTGLTDVGIESFKEKMSESVGHLEKFSFNIADNKVSEENRNFIEKIAH